MFHVQYSAISGQRSWQDGTLPELGLQGSLHQPSQLPWPRLAYQPGNLCNPLSLDVAQWLPLSGRCIQNKLKVMQNLRRACSTSARPTSTHCAPSCPSWRGSSSTRCPTCVARSSPSSRPRWVRDELWCVSKVDVHMYPYLTTRIIQIIQKANLKRVPYMLMQDRSIRSQGDRQLCVLAPHTVHHPNEEGERDCQLQVRTTFTWVFLGISSRH